MDGLLFGSRDRWFLNFGLDFSFTARTRSSANKEVSKIWPQLIPRFRVQKEETRRYFIKGFTSDLNCLSREEWHHYFTAKKNIQYCTQICYIGKGVSHFRFSQWALVLIAVTDLSWTIPMVIDFWALLSTSLIPKDCDTLSSIDRG